MAKRGLGRGLDALMGAGAAETGAEQVGSGPQGLRMISREHLRPSSVQPRRSFDEESLRELAESIRERGMVQPIVARPVDGGYEIVAGERRWRAAEAAGLSEVPVLVRECTDGEALELALVENLQREDLNPIEEAEGYRVLVEEFGLRQEDVADRVGRSRSAVANSLRLLRLPEEIRGWIQSGDLSVGHAKVLLSIPEAAARTALARRCVRDGWSVRMLEAFVEKARGGGSKRAPRPRSERDPILADVENRLQQRLGTRVRIDAKGERGRIEIEYYSAEELNRLLELLGLPFDG